MRTKPDVPESIVAALMPIGQYFDLYMEGDDLIIENACDLFITYFLFTPSGTFTQSAASQIHINNNYIAIFIICYGNFLIFHINPGIMGARRMLNPGHFSQQLQTAKLNSQLKT